MGWRFLPREGGVGRDHDSLRKGRCFGLWASSGPCWGAAHGACGRSRPQGTPSKKPGKRLAPQKLSRRRPEPFCPSVDPAPNGAVRQPGPGDRKPAKAAFAQCGQSRSFAEEFCKR